MFLLSFNGRVSSDLPQGLHENRVVPHSWNPVFLFDFVVYGFKREFCMIDLRTRIEQLYDEEKLMIESFVCDAFHMRLEVRTES